MIPRAASLRRLLRPPARFAPSVFSTPAILALAACAVLPAAVAAQSGAGASADLHSAIAAAGTRVRVSLDLGNVVIHAVDSDQVEYRVHLETNAPKKDSAALLKSFRMVSYPIPGGVFLRGQKTGCDCSGRLWITVNVSVPKASTLDVSTGGGNIDAGDLGGPAVLATAGGNITIGNVAGSARLTSSSGGHLTVRNVAGDLTASTAGGHITAGSITGSAILHTSGGHIRVTSVGGTARLDTGGGNVTLEHAGANLIAQTLGGEIEVGDATGLVHASTGGGGIRVVSASGPTNLQTPSGSIYLTQVNGPVHASTGAGGITAWFTGQGKPAGPCQLQSNDGDIVVYLPRQLPVTIDARIEFGDQHRVIFDPAFPLKVSYDTSSGDRSIRAEGALNGGGEVLHLRAVAGNIRVAMSDSTKQVELYKQQMGEMRKQMKRLQQQFQMQMRVLEQNQPLFKPARPNQPSQVDPSPGSH